MSNMSVFSSEHFVSFMLTLGNDDVVGCHMPQGDVRDFTSHVNEMLNDPEDFPEMEFKTSNTHIEGMSAGESVMFSCRNGLSGKKIQFAIDKEDCQELVSRIQEMANPQCVVVANEKWRFFD